MSMNTLHSCLAYYLLAINAVTFIVYGVDKYKAKKAKVAHFGSHTFVAGRTRRKHRGMDGNESLAP